MKLLLPLIGIACCILACGEGALEATSTPLAMKSRAIEFEKLQSSKQLVQAILKQKGTFGRANLQLARTVALSLSQCKKDCEPAFEALLSSENDNDRWIAYRAALDLPRAQKAKIEPMIRSYKAQSEEERVFQQRVLDR